VVWQRDDARAQADVARALCGAGFVDTHRHMWQGILRNVLPDGSLDDYIATVQKTFGARRLL
jgi:cytosine/adenosine deaminase-related metal-dependent hydrolase